MELVCKQSSLQTELMTLCMLLKHKMLKNIPHSKLIWLGHLCLYTEVVGERKSRGETLGLIFFIECINLYTEGLLLPNI